MNTVFGGLVRLHNALFLGVQSVFQDWLLGLLARLGFGSVLAFYFWNSATTKVIDRQGGGGPFDYFTVESNALAQMAPKTFEAVGYDASKLGPEYWLMAYAGTYAEFLLPALILLGLFTRLASLGMIGFIAVMTWVDVTGHGAAFDATLLFDRLSDHPIMDQRLLWLFPLVYLVVRGAGWVSLDALFGSRR